MFLGVCALLVGLVAIGIQCLLGVKEVLNRQLRQGVGFFNVGMHVQVPRVAVGNVVGKGEDAVDISTPSETVNVDSAEALVIDFPGGPDEGELVDLHVRHF